MYDEIMQELWPKFEKDFKQYTEWGPFLAKVGYPEVKKEAVTRLKKYSRKAKEKHYPEEFRRLIFRDLGVFIIMLYHLKQIHKEDCRCSICNTFHRLMRIFHQKGARGLGFFFDTGKGFDGDVGFRLTSIA